MRLTALLVFAFVMSHLAGQTNGFKLSEMEPGIVAGFNQSFMQPTFAPAEFQSADVLSVSKEQNPGISMGITAAYPLTSYLKVRTALMYNRYDNKLKYLIRNNAGTTFTHIEQPHSATLEVPVHLILSPSNFDSNPSLILGPKYSYNLQKNNGTGEINYMRQQLGLDVGGSMTFLTKYLAITPQLTYTFGLSPVAMRGFGAIGGSVDRVDRNVLQLSVYLH